MPNRRTILRPPKAARVKEVEEHLSPGGQAKYSTKPGASEGTRRKALERARQKQGTRAPRAENKRIREEYETEEMVVSCKQWTPSLRTFHL